MSVDHGDLYLRAESNRWPLRRRSLELQEAICGVLLEFAVEADDEGAGRAAVKVGPFVDEVMRSTAGRWQRDTIRRAVDEFVDVGIMQYRAERGKGRGGWVRTVRFTVFGVRWLSGRWVVAPVAGWRLDGERVERFRPLFEWCAVPEGPPWRDALAEVFRHVGVGRVFDAERASWVVRDVARDWEVPRDDLWALFCESVERWATRPDGVELRRVSDRLRAVERGVIEEDAGVDAEEPHLT